jgi:hypothetical protein
MRDDWRGPSKSRETLYGRSKKVRSVSGGAVIRTWSKVAIVPIRRDLHALTKCKANEAKENDKADKPKKPLWHCLIISRGEDTPKGLSASGG